MSAKEAATAAPAAPAAPKKVATRVGYGQGLLELGKTHPNVVVLDADLSKSTNTGVFAKAHKDRFFNAGIAEANMIGLAAGLATTGKTVFASSFAIFATQRCLNQIFQSVAYTNLDVKIAATHSGVTVGEDGSTHQAIDDIAIMRTMPGMTVVVPADATEAKLATIAAADYYGPMYLRFGRANVPVLFDEAQYGKFQVGKAMVLREGGDVSIIACGVMVTAALEAAGRLAAEGIQADVINMHTIKPLDVDAVLKTAAKTGCVVTAEEHNVYSGLGGAVAEVLAEKHPVPVLRVGVQDRFGQSGTPDELLKEYGLTADDIVAKAKQALGMKKG